jgi:RNA polymerase sigma-70 factor (ECF subfamily)
MPHAAALPTVSGVAHVDLGEIYEAEFQYVFRSLRRLGVKEGDLEDAAHDVFVAVQRHLTDFDSTRPVRPWLFSFAYRVASDYRRKLRHRPEMTSETHELPDARPGADEEVASEQTRHQVLAALDAMGFERRGILVMHDLEGHTVPEIARALNIPLNTAYSRLRLARRDFEVAIARLDGKRGT